MHTVAIIPARGGSRRVPRKNIKPFSGRPILEYSIETALKSEEFNEVYVSTDSQEIADIALTVGAKVIARSAALSVDQVGTQEVIRDALEQLAHQGPICACGIYATAPLMAVEDLKSGRRELSPRRAFAMSVGTHPLQDAGQFYWGWVWAFLQRFPLISPCTAMIPIADRRVCDINTLDDWFRAEAMYLKLKREERL